MRISTRLMLGSLVPVAVAVVAIAGVLYSLFSVSSLQEQQASVIQVRTDLVQLNDFARSYLLHHDARSRRQYLAKSHDTLEHLASAASDGGRYREELLAIRADVKEMNGLFQGMEANASATSPVAREAEERLSGQLFIRSNDASNISADLIHALTGEIVSRERVVSYTVSALTVLAAVILTLVMLALRSGITGSLSRLREGTEAVGSGDLDYRIALRSPDELGDLATSFDGMTARLQQVTVSKAELEREVEERRLAEDRARQELETTEALLKAADALAEWTDLQHVLEALTQTLLRTAGHSRVTVHVWDEEREEMTRVATAGMKRLPVGAAFAWDELPAGTREVLESREPRIVDFEKASDEPGKSVGTAATTRLSLVVPMTHGEHLVGMFAVDDPGRRGEFTDREIRLAEGVAAQAAVAIENARLHEAETAARRSMAERAERIAALIEVAQASSSSLERREVARTVIELVARLLEAKQAQIRLVNRKSSLLEAVATVDPSEAGFLRNSPAMPVDAKTETAEAFRTKRTRVGEDILADLPEESRANAEKAGVRSYILAPLIVGDDAVGTLYAAWGEPRKFDRDQVDFVEGIAAQFALGLQNAALYEVERQRARFGNSMVDINADLASSLDIDETLPGVLARTCQELHCYGAMVSDRVEGGWRVREVVGLKGSPFEPGARFSDEEAPTTAQVLRTRQPYLLSGLSDKSGSADLAERGGYQAYAIYPLIVRAEVTGTLAVFFDRPHELDAVELDYLRRVAFAVSLAEENSRLYGAEHRIAETLQTALLALPERIPGIEFGHLYHSATEAARVGGDFYDLFELEGSVGITVGDMSGHGVDAAVLTSLVKNAIRVQATQEDRKPHELMAATSELLFRNSPRDVFATVFFGVLHLKDGVLEYCNAGHTAAASIGPKGQVTSLPPNSPLIGAFSGESFRTSKHPLGDDLLFLYTDGLTEAKRDRELFGEQALFAMLEKLSGEGPEDTIRRVVDEVLKFSNGRLSDDLAILALQREGLRRSGSPPFASRGQEVASP